MSGSLTKASKQFSSSLNQLSKRWNDSVQKAVSGFGKKKQDNDEPKAGGTTNEE
jgi:hypothetical protein